MKDFRKKKQPLIFRLLLFPDGTPQYDIGSGSGSGELPPDGMSDQSLLNHTELKSFTFFYQPHDKRIGTKNAVRPIYYTSDKSKE